MIKKKLLTIISLLILSFSIMQCDYSTESTQESGKNEGEKIGAVCKDGTRSKATGRGACSHHGGVDHWIYR